MSGPSRRCPHDGNECEKMCDAAATECSRTVPFLQRVSASSLKLRAAFVGLRYAAREAKVPTGRETGMGIGLSGPRHEWDIIPGTWVTRFPAM
jgi:hypothetical protein